MTTGGAAAVHCPRRGAEADSHAECVRALHPADWGQELLQAEGHGRRHVEGRVEEAGEGSTGQGKGGKTEKGVIYFFALKSYFFRKGLILRETEMCFNIRKRKM